MFSTTRCYLAQYRKRMKGSYILAHTNWGITSPVLWTASGSQWGLLLISCIIHLLYNFIIWNRFSFIFSLVFFIFSQHLPQICRSVSDLLWLGCGVQSRRFCGMGPVAGVYLQSLGEYFWRALVFVWGCGLRGGGYISIFWEIFATSGKVLILLGRGNSMKFWNFLDIS